MSILAKFVILIIRIYQSFISPLLSTIIPSSGCRFRPTCSQVTIQGIINNGLVDGLKIGLKQFSRCHPFSKS